MFWNNKKTLEKTENWIANQFMEFDKEIAILGSQIKSLDQRREISADLGSRIADLEVKMSKLWNLLVETTPSGKEKLSKFGRKFGGGSKLNNR